MTAAQRDLFASQEPPGGTQPPSLRPHQAVALQRLLGAFQRVRGALVCHGTGLGKTRLAGAAAWEFKLRGLRVLMICPTIEITRQCYEAMRALGLSATIEQADNRATRPLPDVTVACVATLRKTRLRGFRPDDFGLLIVDECHAAVAARYRAIVDYFASAKLLGVTATADRTDGLSLANVFDEVAHEMSMLEGIQQGYLAPLKFKTAITDFDAKKLRTMAGDVSAGSVEAELTRSGALHEAASTLAELAPIERTVAFLPTVASSKAFVGELLAKGVKALHVDGTTPSDVRKFYFAQIKAGHARVLSNVGCLVEGFDLPEISVVALLNPTKSRLRLTQMVGRGTRLAPGKTHCLVLDFCPGRLRKGRLASPADALAGRMLEDDVYRHVAKEGDLAKAIADAELTAEKLAERKRRAAETAKRKADRVAELAKLAKSKPFTYGVQDHDAAAVLGGQGPATSTYVSNDVTVDEDTWRKQRGICSIKQAKVLERHGLNPHMKRWLARIAMDALKENGWKLPEHIKADPRFYRARDVKADRAAADAALRALKGG
jgi:superfamily II DNA or RNA helicase